MGIVLKISEMLTVLDHPTAYIALFTICWIAVPVLFAILKKTENKIVTVILAFAPIVNFIVFFILNFTFGNPVKSILRYGLFFIAALVYCLAAVTLSKGKKVVRTLIESGVAAVLISAVAVSSILIETFEMHYGNFSRMGYAGSMSALIDELEENYILGEYKKIDYDYLRSVYIPMAEEAEKNKDEAAFAEAVANLCYEFQDGHVYIRITDDGLKADVHKRMSGNDYGFSMLRQSDGSIVAILADEGTEAFRQGIHNGTVITAWDGVGIDEAVRSVRCVSSGVPLRAYPIASNEDVVKPVYLAGQGGDTVEVRFIGDDGKERTAVLSSLGSYYDRLEAATHPLTHKWCDEFGYTKMLDDHCGYICIPRERYDEVLDVGAVITDEYPAVREFLICKIEEMKAMGMDRLVIDLRDNDGGLDGVYEEIVSLFSNEEMKIYAGYYDGIGYKMSRQWVWTVVPDGRYSDIPVVVLVNAGCASSGDVLAHHLSECNNVTMMGITTTWGSAQNMGGECILGGGHIEVRYPVIATLDANGEIFLDAGPDRISSISLDVQIPLDSDAITAIYENGEDYELGYAVDYLNGKLT